MRTCPYCFAPNGDDAPFCVACGRAEPALGAAVAPERANGPLVLVVTAAAVALLLLLAAYLGSVAPPNAKATPKQDRVHPVRVLPGPQDAHGG